MQNCNFSDTATDDLIYMPVIGLAIGMTVEQLDKPWIESSFLLQGFTIKSESDIEALRAECDYVYVAKQEGTMHSSMALGKNGARTFNWTSQNGGRVA